MGIFSRILDKLRGYPSAAPRPQQQTQYAPGQTAQQGTGQPMQNVDVDAELESEPST